MSACRVPYIIDLLQDGLSLSEEKLSIGNGREGWTLGAALAEGGRVGIGRPILEQVGVSIQDRSISDVEGVQARSVAGQGMVGKGPHHLCETAMSPSPATFIVLAHCKFMLSLMTKRQTLPQHLLLACLNACRPSSFRLSRYMPLQGAWDLAIWAKYFAVVALLLCLSGVVSAFISKV